MTNQEFVTRETGIRAESLRWLGKYSYDQRGERATLFFCGPFDYHVIGEGDGRTLECSYNEALDNGAM